MDGVLADFDGATATHLETKNIPIALRKNFYFRYDYPDETHQTVINQLHASQNFFKDLPEIPGAIEGWHRIIELGYEPRICSSPLHTNKWCKEEKLDWIGQHLGEEALRTAIITKEKELCDGIALIDDRPEINGNEIAPWKHVVFDHPYNQLAPSDYRLKGWNDPNLEVILKRAAQAAMPR